MPNPLSKFGLTDMEIDAEMARDPKVLEELERLAHEVEDFWKGIAPVFDEDRDRRKTPPSGDSGAYRDSIHTELIRAKDGLPAARVGTDDYKAIWIELGSRHMPEYAPATQTAHYFGDTTGPRFSEGVQQAQGKLREALEKLAKMKATDSSPRDIKRQRSAVNQARAERSAAFKAAKRRHR